MSVSTQTPAPVTPVLPANFVIPTTPPPPTAAPVVETAKSSQAAAAPEVVADEAPLALDSSLSIEQAFEKFHAEEIRKETKAAQPKVEEKPKQQDKEAASNKDEPAADAALDAEVAQVTKNLTHEQQQAFKTKTYELRDAKRKLKEADAVAAKAAELEAKIKELEARGPEKTVDTTEIEALKAKLEAQELELGNVRLEATDTYRTQIIEPLNKLVTAAVSLTAGIDLLDEADVRAAFQLTGRERAAEISRIAGELNEFDKQEFFTLAREHANVFNKKAEMAANVKESYAKILAEKNEAEQKAQSEYKAQWSKATQDSWSKVTADAPILKPIDGNDAWNQGIEQAKNFANRVSYDELNATSQAEAMHRAGAWPLLNGYANALAAAVSERDAKLVEAHAEIARLTGALPGAGPSAPGVDRGTRVDPDANASFEDSVANRANRAGLFAK